MNIYLISASHRNPDGSLYKAPRYWTSGITLPYLRALTPSCHRVEIVDEITGTVDLESTADVIGITGMGPQMARAYELGDHFRARGRPVVMGGTWASLVPDQALSHADAVVVGEAEHVWESLLNDVAAGCLKPKYQADRWHTLENLPRFDYWSLPLFHRQQWERSAFYRQYFHWPISISRGCPHTCEYCAVQTYYAQSFRSRPIDEVIEDFRTIKAMGGKKVLILDDNPIGNKQYAKELFRALTPLGIKWASQCTINIARDAELLDLAAKAGCVTLSIGLESVSESNLNDVGKRFGKPERYSRDLAAIRGKGIQIIALMMLGLDHDDASSFARTLQFLVDNKISFLKLFLPCPYPGTKYYDDMEAAGRITTHDWGRYDYGSAIVKPVNVKSQEMLDGFTWVYKQFYSPRNILRRMLPPPSGNYLETLFYTIGNYKVHRSLRNWKNTWAVIG
ncbi:MAG: B12-binding domain-containing radical SAM protein [Candidatus Schekmanbacteria bacterium]|nr:B12-binding domain-containing radical SAM protein [Candidatus Schekmanbacteria bacterium]